MQLGEITAVNVGGLLVAQRRHCEALQQVAIVPCGAGLAFGLDVIGEEAVGKFGERERLAGLALLRCRIGAEPDLRERIRRRPARLLWSELSGAPERDASFWAWCVLRRWLDT